MNFFYNIGIIFYGFSIWVAALFDDKAKLWIAGRKGIWNKIKHGLKNETRPIVWIHCSSLGEFEQGRPIIEALHRDLKTYALVLSFFSPSGYDVRKNYLQADYIFYLPLDTPKNAKQFLKLVKPVLAIFVKYEFWLNYLKEIRRQNIPTILMSAKFRPGQLFFRWYGKFYQKAIFAFEHIFVQNEESKMLLQNIGYSGVSVAGDTRFDRVMEIAKKAKQFIQIKQFTTDKFSLIAGSTWEKDETILSDFFNRNNNENLRLILAPHEINSRHLKQVKLKFNEPILFFSKLMMEDTIIENVRILVIDTIGILSSIYQYGTVAYIGGGFGKGIHNVLEAATFGLPTIFGPNYQKFSEAVDLIKLKGGFSIKTAIEFDKIVGNFLENKTFLEKASQISKKFIKSNCGAQKMIMDHIFNIQKNL